jgi:RNase P subunit RPR2
MAESRGIVRKIAAERIEILYGAAVRAFPSDRDLSKSYITTLEEIGRHYKVRIPKGMAARICKSCSTPLIEGVNLQVRVIAADKRTIYRCAQCGNTNSLAFAGKSQKK